ncbi:cytochrome d ubiquinol oxidase subunit II [uncultured Paludibaculum sp.]|uniref:cytochrome d ubiquinol oxidase subunit II n=1 Tax=uncultured Paludibaculum sp. TaxID=1765020 RepID=UPI002AAC3FA2|nr:cytochrome d ubiquinol oxidase subunit II [uncultured Paludibaculum sp.]
MVEAWFGILCLMIAFFVILDGWDIGAGMLHFVVARDQDERRVLIAAVGPLWSWHEVWLVGTGGVLFVAFPRVLSIAFPGYYLALFLVLWTLVMRGISLEFRGHIDDRMWRSFWDFGIAVSNTLLAVLFGAALGNVIRGMPLGADAELSLPLFTHFGVQGSVGILDWYTLSVAVFTVVCLAAHGASYLALKTMDAVHERSRRLSGWLWLTAAALLAMVSGMTWVVRPELFVGLAARPIAWLTAGVLAGGAVAILTGVRSGADIRVFLGGCAVIAGLLATAAVSLFPVMLHSTLDARYSITAFNGSADPSSLRAAVWWWPVAFVLSFFYFGFIGKHYMGRVEVSKDSQQPY